MVLEKRIGGSKKECFVLTKAIVILGKFLCFFGTTTYSAILSFIQPSAVVAFIGILSTSKFLSIFQWE